MKKLLLILAIIACAMVSYGQTFTPDVVHHGIKYNKTHLLKTIQLKEGVNGDYTVPMTLTTPALQLSFTEMEKINGGWTMTTPVAIGYSYIYSYANGVVHQDSSITVENRFFFGGGFNFGVKPNSNGTLVGTLPVGAIVGFSKYGLFGGYDVLNGKPLIAVSLNLLNFPFLQSLTKFNVKQ